MFVLYEPSMNFINTCIDPCFRIFSHIVLNIVKGHIYSVYGAKTCGLHQISNSVYGGNRDYVFIVQRKNEKKNIEQKENVQAVNGCLINKWIMHISEKQCDPISNPMID